MTMTSAVPVPRLDDSRIVVGVAEARRLIQQAARDYGADFVGQWAYADWSGHVEHGEHGEHWVQVVEIGCIVGYVWHALGVPKRELHKMPYPTGAYADFGPGLNAPSNTVAFFSPAAESLLAQAMRLNDDGIRWGAIATALAA